MGRGKPLIEAHPACILCPLVLATLSVTWVTSWPEHSRKGRKAQHTSKVITGACVWIEYSCELSGRQMELIVSLPPIYREARPREAEKKKRRKT